MSIRVVLVDDDQLIRDSLKIVLETDKDIKVEATCKNGDEALKKSREIIPDVVLMDIRMPIYDGVAATKLIKDEMPGIKIIILTTFDDDDYIIKALKGGASGYLMKNVSPGEIIEAIKVAYEGNLLIHGDIASKISLMLKPKEKELDLSQYGLLEKEIVVIELISKGLSNSEIGEKLFLSEGTVKNYISRILAKLELRDRTQIAVFYLNRKNN